MLHFNTQVLSVIRLFLLYEASHEKTCIQVFQQGLLSCTATEDGYRLEISDLGSRGIALSYVAKTKSLIRCAVNVQLICAFVFAYAKTRFSHDAPDMTLSTVI